MTSETTFIYALNDPITGRTRYVGKANDPEHRLKEHLAVARNHCHSYKDRWISSLLIQNLEPQLEILERVSTGGWQEAERDYIKFFRLFGCRLCNLTDGGEGLSNPSVETRRKIGEASRLKVYTPAMREAIGLRHKGRKHSEETRRKIGEANSRRVWSEKSRAKTRHRMLGVVQNVDPTTGRFLKAA